MNNKYFNTFKLVPAGKEPTSEWNKDKTKSRFINKHLWQHKNLNQLKEMYMKENRGIVCGKASNIIVVDLDFYDKFKNGKTIKFDAENNKFIQDFGKLFQVGVHRPTPSQRCRVALWCGASGSRVTAFPLAAARGHGARNAQAQFAAQEHAAPNVEPGADRWKSASEGGAEKSIKDD